jgi:hypothetical protein
VIIEAEDKEGSDASESLKRDRDWWNIFLVALSVLLV